MQVNSGQWDVTGLVWDLEEGCLRGAGSTGRALFVFFSSSSFFWPEAWLEVWQDLGPWRGHGAAKQVLACMEQEDGAWVFHRTDQLAPDWPLCERKPTPILCKPVVWIFCLSIQITFSVICRILDGAKSVLPPLWELQGSSRMQEMRGEERKRAL